MRNYNKVTKKCSDRLLTIVSDRCAGLRAGFTGQREAGALLMAVNVFAGARA